MPSPPPRPFFPSVRNGAGTLDAALLVLCDPPGVAATLLAIAIWAFCRAYYFAFYVVERYADPAYRFSGLLSFARYLLRARRIRRSYGAAGFSPPTYRLFGGLKPAAPQEPRREHAALRARGARSCTAR